MGQTADESKSMIERVARINAEQVVAIDTTLERRASEENPTPGGEPAGDPDTTIVADMGDHLLETAGAPMQSLSDKERRCVKQAREKHVQALQRQVEDLATRPDPLFAGPLAGFDGLQRQDTTRGRVIQMLLMPLSILVIGVLALGTPFAYLGHLLNRRKSREARQIEMGALRAKIAAMRNDLSLPGPIEPKTIGGLWSACAIGGMSLSDQEALQLLNEWVETLYGRATRDTLQLENRAAAIHRDRAETYARAAMNGIFVTHMSILAVLLREIEQELPPYGQVGER
jgi:hypothetical protein